MAATPSPTTDAAVEALVRQIYGLGRARREIGRHALAELGGQGFVALGIVSRYGPIRISEVAHRLTVDLSVASRQIGTLAEAGYVTRERDTEDRRAQVVSATDKGREVLRRSHERMVAAFADVLGDWTEDDLLKLTEQLARLNEAFEA